MAIHDKEKLAVPHPPLQEYYSEEAQRRKFVSELFDKTAHHYDWVIRAMSFGSGNWYRNQALLRAGLKPEMAVLDIATGTGPVAQSISRIVSGNGSVVGLDRSINMLHETAKHMHLPLVQADAGVLPFPDQSFDFITMGYALRHVDDLHGLFSEYFRVLRPGGKILLMELTSPDSRLGFILTKFYMRRIVPLIARLGTGSKDAKTLMTYFWDTIEHCVRPDGIIEQMKLAGLEDVRRHKVLGIFSEYTGLRKA